ADKHHIVSANFPIAPPGVQQAVQSLSSDVLSDSPEWGR
ncbi:hypothetical protein A2U01_0112141, partial [Trifolium medium]|nr:hypothetical protein [Trifolium medium]